MDMGFRELWTAGYRTLVPITSPDGEPSPHGVYARRPQDMGKGPGVRGHDGLWHGVRWHLPDFAVQPHQFDHYEEMGCGAGVKVGVPDADGWCVSAIDGDILHEGMSLRARDLAWTMLGLAPVRVGQAPKWLMPFRSRGPLRNGRVLIDDGVTEHPKQAQVDALCSGKQFVAHGIHSGTGKPYEWSDFDIFAGLPEITQEKLDAFLAAIAAEFPKGKMQLDGGSDRAGVDQDSLKGDPARVAAAFAALPNGRAFRGYDEFRNLGIALKAAMADEPDDALALWLDWCARWEDGEQTAEQAQRYWRSFRPPFALGAAYVFEQARKHADPGEWTPALAAFDVIPEPTGAEAEAQEAVRRANEAAGAIAWAVPSRDWRERVPAVREWYVSGFVPRGETTLLYGDGGVGKSLLALALAVCVATGKPFLGLNVKRCTVALFMCEDDTDEMHRRLLDIMAALDVTWDDIGDRIRVADRKWADNTLATFDGSNVMSATELHGRLVRDIRDMGAELTILDTLTDVFAGNEIVRQQARQFIQKAVGAVVQANGGAAIVLGHPSRAGMATGTGDSGSTGWSNTVRSRLYMQRVEGDNDLRTLTVMKGNYGSLGDTFNLRWRAGQFDLVNAVVTNRANLDNPDDFPDAGPINDESVLEALRDLEGQVLSDKAAAKNSIHTALKRHAATQHMRKEEIASTLARLIRTRAVNWKVTGRDKGGRDQSTIVVHERTSAVVSPFDNIDDADPLA